MRRPLDQPRQLQHLRAEIDPMIEALTAAGRAGCQCPPCQAAAGLARTSLAYLSPLGAELALVTMHDEDFFARLTQHMQEEIARLARTLRQVQALRCERLTENRQEERPRGMHRRARITMKKNPRIPGTFIMR
jgi:uncharacterized protein with von Willebrand factor type A (vWA) domain